MALTVRDVGLERVLKKLDVDHLTEGARRRIFREASETGRDFLSSVIPRDTGASAQTMDLSVRDSGFSIEDSGARLAVTADPLRYPEFGTKSGATKTLGQARGRWHIRTSGGEQRIKRRRFMARTIGKTRREVSRLTKEAVKDVEKRWAE